MKLAIMQPYFMPYIGYFQLIYAVDKFIVYDDVNYIKKGWINRNQFVCNKQAMTFTLPLDKPSQNKLICEIELSNDLIWKTKLMKTIEMNYKKTSQFNQVFPIIESIINFESRNLSDYIYNCLTQICDYLEINTFIEKTSRIFSNTELKGSDRIIDICIRNDATTYINPKGGIELYNRTDFEKNNMNLQFLYPKLSEYQQRSDDFIPGLSILDLIMNINNEEIRNHLNSFNLK